MSVVECVSGILTTASTVIALIWTRENVCGPVTLVTRLEICYVCSWNTADVVVSGQTGTIPTATDLCLEGGEGGETQWISCHWKLGFDNVISGY